MKRLAILAYGLAVYALFLWTILYAIGFVTGIIVPRTIDDAPIDSSWLGWATNLGILSLFAIQHTIMARQGFKDRLAQIMPRAAERSTFVLMTCLILNLLFFAWQAIPGQIWHTDHEVAIWALKGLSLGGWVMVFITTFLIDHFELFGLTQVWNNFRNKTTVKKSFVTPWVYKYSRHPMYLGFFIAFWATPTMTTGHLIFAAVTTAYVIFEVFFFEEPDLVRDFGKEYRNYQHNVPMFLANPLASRRQKTTTETPLCEL